MTDTQADSKAEKAAKEPAAKSVKAGKDMASKVGAKLMQNVIKTVAAPAPVARLSRKTSKLEESKPAKAAKPVKEPKAKAVKIALSPAKKLKFQNTVEIIGEDTKTKLSDKHTPKSAVELQAWVMRKREEKAAKKKSEKIAKAEKSAGIKRTASKSSEKK